MSSTSQAHKPFFTYEEQLCKLKAKGLSITDADAAIKLLKEHSYFALISGYKTLFKGKNGQYKLYTSIEDIYSLYAFDDALRALFLQHILKVEKHIKSLISYVFCYRHGAEQNRYLDMANYAQVQPLQRGIKVLIEKLTDIIQYPTYDYITYHKEKYNNVPLWVMMKALPFGTVSKMYSFLPQSLQSEISKEFPHVHTKMLQEMLAMLSRVRNVCAHNERLFDYQDTRYIPNTDMHHALNIPTAKNHFLKGKRDLFAVIIVLKYLCDDKDFVILIDTISSMLASLCNDVQNIEVNQIHKCMGLPPNWEDVAMCVKLK